MIDLLLLPFRAVWALIGIVFNLTGRLLGVVAGIVLMVVGLALTVTLIGAVIGVPLLIVGFLLIVRSLLR